MNYLFVVSLIIGAIGIQFINAWISKNPFTLNNFLMLVPFIIIAQYFITSGYHYGTGEKSFIFAHIIWMIALLATTLIANYVIFGTIPGPITLLGLVLATIAAVLAATGK